MLKKYYVFFNLKKICYFNLIFIFLSYLNLKICIKLSINFKIWYVFCNLYCICEFKNNYFILFVIFNK